MKTSPFLLCVWLTLAAFTASAAGQNWVEFPAGLTYPLLEKDGLLSTRIRMNRAPGAPELAELSPQRQDLVSVDAPSGSLASKVTVTLDPGSRDLAPALVLAGKAQDFLPGTYTLVLEFARAGASTNDPRQTVALTLQRAAPQLTSLRVVRAWQERGLFSTESTSGRIQLREATGKAAVRGITVGELRNDSPVPRPETGRLVVDPGFSIVAAGTDTDATVALDGEFPIGKSTGKLHLRSPFLPTPVSVDYEVTAVRTRIWIALCAAAGASCGFLVRVHLRKRREHLRAQITASEAMEAVSKARQAIPDATFAIAVKSIEDDLRRDTTTADADRILEAAAKARRALADAQSELNTRRKVLADELVPLQAVLELGWRLPSTVAESLATARTLASSIRALADAQDAAQALARMSKEMTKAREDLANAADKWRADAARYLAALATHPPALPAGGSGHLADAVATWKTGFPSQGGHVGIDRAGLEKELATTNAAYAQGKAIIEGLKSDGIEVAEWARNLIAGKEANPALDPLVKLAVDRGAALYSELEHPDGASMEPARWRRMQQVSWETALRSVIPAAPPDTVVAALKKGEWTTAAEAAHKLLQQEHPDSETTLGSPNENDANSIKPTEARSPIARSILLHTSPPVYANSSHPPLSPVLSLTGTATERTMIAKEEAWAAFLQSAILAGLFIALAYGLQSDTWVGSPKEMLTLFVWAFSLDLTAENLAPLIKKISGPATGS